MPTDANPISAFPLLLQVERFYAGFVSFASPGGEPSLGGMLFHAGELDADGRALTIAGNIAGVATLAATADPDAQKQAVRHGVIDFLVTSLDEALRILKNEIRKRDSVSVYVAGEPDGVQLEMLERGVLPDLVRPADPGRAHSPFLAQGARPIPRPTLNELQAIVTWQVGAAPAQWLPKLDALAQQCLAADAWEARRWLRLAPRYMGRLAKGLRPLVCDRDASADFIERVRRSVEAGEVPVPVEIQVLRGSTHDVHHLVPPSR